MHNDCFWNFPHHCKYDVLDEKRHAHLLVGALKDRCTRLDRVDRNTFILYGDDEAVLIKPKSLVVRIALELYGAFISNIR